MVRTDRGPTGYEVMRQRCRVMDNGLGPRIPLRQEIRHDRLTTKPPYEGSDGAAGWNGQASAVAAPGPLHGRTSARRRLTSLALSVSRKSRGAGLLLPWSNIEAMALHLAAISQTIEPGRHAALLLGQAGLHVSAGLLVPENITIVLLPAECPELSRQENVWPFMRGRGWQTGRSYAPITCLTTAALPGLTSSD